MINDFARSGVARSDAGAIARVEKAIIHLEPDNHPPGTSSKGHEFESEMLDVAAVVQTTSKLGLVDGKVNS